MYSEYELLQFDLRKVTLSPIISLWIQTTIFWETISLNYKSLFLFAC